MKCVVDIVGCSFDLICKLAAAGKLNPLDTMAFNPFLVKL